MESETNISNSMFSIISLAKSYCTYTLPQPCASDALRAIGFHVVFTCMWFPAILPAGCFNVIKAFTDAMLTIIYKILFC